MPRFAKTYRVKVCRTFRQTLLLLITAIVLTALGFASAAAAEPNFPIGTAQTANSLNTSPQEPEEGQEEIEEVDVDSSEESESDEEIDTLSSDENSDEEDDLPFTLSVAADVFSQRMAKGTSISNGNPTFSPSVDLSHTSGLSAGLSMDQMFGSVSRFQSASAFIDYEYELSDYFGIGATYTHGFYSESDTAIFAYAANQFTLYTDFYWNGLLAGVDVDYYFGDNHLLYFSSSLSYSIDINDDFKLTPSIGTSISYNEVQKGKSKSTRTKSKQEIAFSNVFAGVSASYSLGSGFEANASIRVIYSKEETSNKKSTQFSAMAGISYDLDF